MPILESNLIIERCPHCNVHKPNLICVAQFSTNNYNVTNKRNWKVYNCQRCGGVVTAWAYSPDNNIRQMFPTVLVLDNSIPERAKAYLDQAINSIRTPSGAIMLAVSSIDFMLKDKGYKETSLYSRINKAVEDHLITK